MTQTVGIDLGTTHSLIAVLGAEGPRLLTNALGSFLTPSVIAIDHQERVLVGQEAREFQVLHPERCASVFKRHMGSDWSTQIGGQTLNATQLSSWVLRSLRADAEAQLGVPVTQAVITVPAYFNEDQRRATIAAGQMAGLKVDRILNEPTAAAIAYGLHDRSQEKVAVVIDLGGGTFDVSVVEIFEGTLEIRASAGEVFLGGEDFTNAMVSHILCELGLVYERAEMEQPLRVSRLRRECELAKRRLAKEESTSLRLPDAQGQLSPDSPEREITREQFDQWTRSILDRMLPPIRRALGDARIDRTKIDEVLLVGGATRMPAVVSRIEELFQMTPRCSINPDEVVALGSAVHGGIVDRDEKLVDFVVTDVSPFSLGVEVSHTVGGREREGYFLPIINRNSTIPTSRVESVCTLHPNQKQVKISVYQGESRYVKDNSLLGEFEVTGIPLGPAGQRIDIRFTYDVNGVLEVEATVSATQKKVSHVFTRHAAHLSSEDVQKALESMRELKLHPRDDQPNRYLLSRAERLYVELPLDARDHLEGLLRGFEEVLELRDQQAIVKFREALTEFLNQFDAGDDLLGEQGGGA